MVTASGALTEALNNMGMLWETLFGLPTSLLWLLVIGVPLVLLFISLRRRGKE